jgi:hypothetical protein
MSTLLCMRSLSTMHWMHGGIGWNLQILALLVVWVTPSAAAMRNIWTTESSSLQTNSSDTSKNVVFIHKGNVSHYMVLALMQLHQSVPDARVFIVLAPGSKAASWDGVLQDIPHVKLWQPRYTARYEGLLATYRHASGNTFEYERFCVARHLLLLEFFARERLSSAFYLDLDVVVFGNTLFQVVPPGITVHDTGTFAIHWTASGLAAFAQYLEEFYQRSEVCARRAYPGLCVHVPARGWCKRVHV